ncbi:MAG: hypothetical protein HF314_10335 [Ignavibacteria bacterium]|jgi:hypothetical protein|nr:hypothetical protein [Ignavibacteria bacterium]MCU7503463.1 hypothetical protein [Ignavibacteria bacterium]MCU7516205.1 hypothetical protein [Ignavibacteria bacterium]
MKNKLIFILIVVEVFLSFNCAGTRSTNANAWKEKYNLLPGTGILYGKFGIRQPSATEKLFLYLVPDSIYKRTGVIYKWTAELMNLKYGSVINQDSTLMITNIAPGDYVMILRLKEEKSPGDLSGTLAFHTVTQNIDSYGALVTIKENMISYFLKPDEIPGNSLLYDSMSPDDKTPSLIRVDNSSKADLGWMELNQQNYLKLIKGIK